jgi:hypothetical protein
MSISPIRESQKPVITRYKLNEYTNVNRALREPRRMTPGIQSFIDQLDAVINKTANTPVILYRGLSIPLKGKKNLVEPAYSSTTTHCSVADTFTDRDTRCCVLKVTVPPSIKRYNYISNTDDDNEERENENEVLLERGLEYYEIVDTKKRCGKYNSSIYECKVRKYVPMKTRSSSKSSSGPRSITRNKSRSKSLSKSRSIQKSSSRPSSKKRISDDSLDKMLDDILKEGGGVNRSKNGCYYRRLKRSRRGSRQGGSRR